MTENRLKDSASPYLRSAAHQPIKWYEWGTEAFAQARTPISPFCWTLELCGATGATSLIERVTRILKSPKIINKLFVPVKVDRDERPDVDSRYQAAISAISGQGGWPLPVS